VQTGGSQSCSLTAEQFLEPSCAAVRMPFLVACPVDVLELVREEADHPGVLPEPSSGTEMHGKKHNKNVHEVREPRPDPLKANNRRSRSGREECRIVGDNLQVKSVGGRDNNNEM
jgi:hypothetical protein